MALTTGVRINVSSTAIASGTMTALPTYRTPTISTRHIKTGRNDAGDGRLRAIFTRASYGRNRSSRCTYFQHMLCRRPQPERRLRAIGIGFAHCLNATANPSNRQSPFSTDVPAFVPCK
jgi:hypothetical protein